MSKTNYIATMQGMPILADRAKKTESGVDKVAAASSHPLGCG